MIVPHSTAQAELRVNGILYEVNHNLSYWFKARKDMNSCLVMMNPSEAIAKR